MRRVIPALAAVLASVSCSESPIAAVVPEQTLVVITTTTGLDVPAGLYTVVVDGQARGTIHANSSLAIKSLTAGKHDVSLDVIASNCRAESQNPASVTVGTNETISVPFSLTCLALTGNIAVTISAPGLDFPAERMFGIRLDDAPVVLIAANKTTSISNISTGEHSLRLSPVPGNCKSSPEASVTFNLTAGPVRETVPLHFDVTCARSDRFGSSVLAFERDERILLTATDGSSVIDLVRGIAPGWSPDGSKLVFGTPSCYRSAELDCVQELQMMDAFGTYVITSRKGNSDYDPAWSPDGRRISFTRFVDGPDQTYLELLSLEDLTKGTFTVKEWDPISGPSWSPDGRQIAFTCEGSRPPVMPANPEDICVIDSQGTGFVRLTRNNSGDYDPAWSPDGKRIAFTAKATTGDTEPYIALMTPDGKEFNRLIAGSDPAWSPDGTRIIFVGSSAMPGLHIVNVDGTGLVQITTSPQDRRPAWRR